MALVSITTVRVSIPNLAQNLALPLIIGTAALGYCGYVTRIRGNESAFSFEWPPLSPRLLLLPLLAGFLGAAFVLLTGNRFISTSGIMLSGLYIGGLIAAAVLSVLRPHLGVCTLILTLPFALLLHLNLRGLGQSEILGFVVMNPEIFLILVTSLAILVGLWTRREGLVRTRLDIPISIFLLGSLISLFYSPDISLSARVLFAGTFIPILSYYIIVNGLRTEKELILVVSVILFSFFLMGSYSLLLFQRDTPTVELLSGEERLTHFFLNPGLFTVMLSLALPIPLRLAASSAVPLRVRFAAGLLFTILLASVAFTYVRGAWVGLAVSVGVLLLFSSEVRRLFLRVSPLLLVAILIWGGVLSQILWARTESLEVFFQSGSWTERVVFWESAWQMIIHNPLTGVGPGMFGVYYPEYEVTYLAFAQTTGANAHNLLLNVWAETGLLAALGLTGFLVGSLWKSYEFLRSTKDPLMKAISLGLLAGLIGYLINASLHGTFLVKYPLDELSFFSGHTLYMLIILGLIAALTRIGDKA
ncbi:O-antigen ligase family protein [Chloroflexota bacterium]